MTKGNYTIAHLDVAVDKAPQNVQKKWDLPECSMRIMQDNNTARGYGIPRDDAIRIAKKINVMKKELRAEMMAATRRYQKGAR